MIYRRYGIVGFQFQGIASLDGYRNESIARTLMSTGQYADDTAFKRFLLTANFWMEVSEPERLKTFAPGWQVALRVRLLHTLIRQAVLNSPNWDAKHLGMPISQVGLLGAPLLSSVALGNLMKLVGYRANRHDIEALQHLWRYIGHLMGLRDELFPKTVEDGIQTLFTASQLSPPSNRSEGIELGRSFLASFRPPDNLKGTARLSRWLEYNVNIAQTAFCATPETRKAIGSPNPWAQVSLYWLYSFPLNLSTGLLSQLSPTFRQWLDTRTRRKRRQWVERQLGEADLVYRPQSKF